MGTSRQLPCRSTAPRQPVDTYTWPPSADSLLWSPLRTVTDTRDSQSIHIPGRPPLTASSGPHYVPSPTHGTASRYIYLAAHRWQPPLVPTTYRHRHTGQPVDTYTWPPSAGSLLWSPLRTVTDTRDSQSIPISGRLPLAASSGPHHVPSPRCLHTSPYLPARLL